MCSILKLLRQKTAGFAIISPKEKPIVNVAENQIVVYQPNGTVRLGLHVS